MSRFWTFALIGPALYALTAVFVVMPLVSLFENHHFQIVEFTAIPFALATFAFAGLLPSLLCCALDAQIVRVEIISRLVFCGLLGFVVGLILPGVIVLMGIPQSLLPFGMLGAISGAGCSWIYSRSAEQ
jgi:hypothetical protein